MIKRVLSVFTALFAVVSAFAGVAKIGDTEYATIDAAFNAVKVGETIELLADVECSASIVQARNFTLEGHNHTLKCSASSDKYDYFVNVNGGSTQTFKNLTIDANGKEPYAVQCIGSASKLVLDNVTIKNAKGTLVTMGYGIHVNGGKVVANNLKVSDCSTASVFLTGNSSNGTTPSFEITGDNCDLDVVGVEDGITPALSVTAKGFSVYDVSAKYSYSILIGTREGTKNLSNVISALSWNQAISEIQSRISGLSVKVKSATVTLKGDVKFKEAFTSNESRLTVDGAGKTVTGKFIFNSSTPTTIKNIVLGDGSILDCTASTKTGFSGVSVAANTTIDILLPASTDINSYALPVSLGTDAVANITVGEKKYIAKNGVISSAEKLAQIGDKQYATLQEAIDAANGAVVQVLKDVALTSPLTVPAGKTLTLNLAGRKVTISGANYALINNGNLTIVDMGLVSLVAAEATIGDEDATPILIMAPSANDGVAVIDDATGGSIAGVQNNGTFALESGAVVAASASVPAIDNTANAVATITGGTVEGKLQSVDKTALTITGGSFTGGSNVSDFVGGDYGVDSNGTIVKNVAKVGEVGYLTLDDAIAAAQAGETIVLAEDIAISKPIILTKNVTIDGGNKTITPAADFVADGNLAVIVFANGATAYSADRNYTVKNLTIEGFSGLARVLRANFCDSLIENCSFVNNSVSEGVVTTSYGKTNVKDCTFDGNTSAFSIVNIGFDVSSGTELAVTVDGSEFIGNKAAIALIYAASSVAVTDNYFNGNIHSGDNANAAAVLAGPYTGTVSYTVDIKENAFVNAFGQEGGNALPDVYAEDWSETWNATTSFDLSSNYWNGGEPNYAVSGKPSIDLTNYYTIYADGVKGGLTEVKVDVAKIGETPYATLAAAVAEATEGQTITLISDVQLTEMLTIPAGKTVTLDLNGKQITSGFQEGSTTKHIYPLDVYGIFTIKDTVGDGSITGRGIFVQAGAKLTIASGSIYAIDSNGGSALFMYGGDVVINGGHIEQKAEGTYNFAINGLGGTVTVNNGWVGGNHGAIAAGGATVVINGGTLVCTGTASMTDNVLYSYDTGSITINGGTFIGDSDTASGGCCVYDANGGATINGGTFGNTSGGDVWGTTGTTIKGGTFSNLTETKHIAAGYELNADGQVVAKPVAKIGDTPYATLEEAVAAANQNVDEQVTITLLDDTTFEGDDLLANLVLDLNGKTITATGSYVFWYEGEGASLVIKDSSAEQTGMIDGSETVGNAFLLWGGQTLTVDSGIIHANNNVFYTYGSGNVITINGGELKSYIDSGNIFYLVGEGNTITVNDGIFIGNVNPYAAGLSISGGVFTVDVNNYCASGFGAILNSDGLYEIVAVDASSAAAKIGDEYFLTLNAALQVAQESDTIVILKDYQGALNTLKGKLVPEEGKTVTITATNRDWYYLPYDFEIGSGITLNMPNGMLFVHNTDNAVISGTVTALGLYIRYAGTKLIINEPGSLTITGETFFIRDVASDANAGIYINGDNDDSTIGLRVPVIYFYQGMINAKDATIKVGTYWQTQETDAGSFANAGSANLVLDNTKMSVGPNENIMKATGVSTVTLKNGSQVFADSGYIGVAPSIDETSSMTMNGVSIFAAKVDDKHYVTLNDAFSVATNGATMVVLKDTTVSLPISYYSEKALVLDLNGKKVSSAAQFSNEAELTVRDSSAEKTGEFNMAIVNSGKLQISSGLFTGTISGEGEFAFTGGTFAQDVAVWCAEGYQSVKQPGKDLWQVGKLPNAEVINVGPYTVDEESYYIYNITNKSFTSGHKDEFDLQVTLGFIANDTVEEAAANAYGQYLTDFRIKIEGIENGSFVADKDCYLAGYYPFFGGWVKVNLDGMTIENNVGYPVITGVTEMPFTYETICDIVKSFICGIHLSDEVLQANPNLKVSLELGLAETQEKMLDGTGFVTVGDTYDYTVEELASTVALTGSDYYTTVDDAVAAALETGDLVKLVNDASLKGNLEFGKKFVLDLGGKTLAADGKTLLIDNSYVVMTNGTLDAFTTTNVTLAGNAILTVTDAVFANNFRALETHYVSANANGTYSIMLKTAFRTHITVVDGKARVGFFKDGSASYTIKAATNLETPEWDVIQSEEATDAADVSELPLYWVKTTEGEKEYRFFKLSVE